MMTPTEFQENLQKSTDNSHLKLLTIASYVIAGLSLLGIGFLFLHYQMMSMFFNNPEMLKNSKGGPPPQEFFVMFKLFYPIMGCAFLVVSIGNFLSAIFISKRKYSTFSLIVAGFNCPHFPLGTALGVFTIMVLIRPTVVNQYSAIKNNDGR